MVDVLVFIHQNEEFCIRWYLSRVVLGVMATARIVWVVNIAGSLIALAPVLQVKDTGKNKGKR